MIGNAEEKGELYQISRLDHPTEFRSSIQSSLATILKSNVMLWHQQLGHPNFEYVRVLYPSLSSNKIQNFHCEHCILAKQTKSSHLNHIYKPSKPFHLIHNYIWGPVRTHNLTNTRWFLTFIDDYTRVS